jgi:hypothetical protein
MLSSNIFKGLFGPVEAGCVKFATNGLAIKTSNGYRVYNPKTGILVNPNGFVFPGFAEAFFSIPTTHVKAGDIIVSNGKPVYVLEVKDKSLKVLSYEGGEIKEILPERHQLMGQRYIYPKIVCPFGNIFSGKGDFMKNMLKMSMFGMMFGKGAGSDQGGTPNVDGSNPFMQMLMMQSLMGSKNDGGLLDNLFGEMDFGDLSLDPNEENMGEDDGR